MCEGITVPGKELENLVARNLMELSEDRKFLNDRKKMLKALDEQLRPKQSAGFVEESVPQGQPCETLVQTK